MRLSSVLFGTVVASVLACVSGCRVSVETKTRFTLDTGPSTVKEDTADWAGQRIVIDIQGVGASVNGGVKVTADPNVKKVTASTRFLAMAFEKADADQSIEDAKATYALTSTADEIKIVCGHGQKHGSSEAGESGCELVEVRIPAGADAKKVDVKVLSGNGTLTLQLAAATISNVAANSNGADINADLPATLGGTISLVSEKDDIAVKLPADFAADEVILQADSDKIVLGPFTDIKNGPGAGGRGTAGTGLASLKLTAKEFAGSTGTITLRR
jgi:hypothetical protein